MKKQKIDTGTPPDSKKSTGKQRRPIQATPSAAAALPREKKEKPITPEKLKATTNPEDDTPLWMALDWNKAGGQHAKQYPFVVVKKPEGPEAFQCLAGETNRLLRFMTERAAQSRANQMNQAILFAQNQIKLF